MRREQMTIGALELCDTATITTLTTTTMTLTNLTLTNLNGTELAASTKELNRNDDDFTYETFTATPACQSRGGGAASGTGGDENIMICDHSIMEYYMMGTQSILEPVKVADGIDVALDQTDNDGAEFTMGITAFNKHSYTIDTDAFYAIWKFTIAVVAGTDDFAVGFRADEAYDGTLLNYIDYAVLNVQAGDIIIETDLNNGGTPDATDTTDDWADTETHTLEVYVDITGAVTYKIDGAAPTVTKAFTFDTGDVVVPFFHFLQANAAQTGVVIWHSFECGKTN